MYNTNVIVISGKLTADPDIRQTQSGTWTARFTVAVNKGDKGADFLPVVAFGKTAEAVRSYLGKGSSVIVSGALHSSKYTDRNGSSRTGYEISADSVEFTGAKKQSGDQTPDFIPQYDGNLSDFEEIPLNEYPFG